MERQRSRMCWLKRIGSIGFPLLFAITVVMCVCSCHVLPGRTRTGSDPEGGNQGNRVQLALHVYKPYEDENGDWVAQVSVTNESAFPILLRWYRHASYSVRFIADMGAFGVCEVGGWSVGGTWGDGVDYIILNKKLPGGSISGDGGDAQSPLRMIQLRSDRVPRGRPVKCRVRLTVWYLDGCDAIVGADATSIKKGTYEPVELEGIIDVEFPKETASSAESLSDR